VPGEIIAVVHGDQIRVSGIEIREEHDERTT
jgi:hypothetical protein